MTTLRVCALGAAIASVVGPALPVAQDLIVPGDPAANIVVIAPEYPLDRNIFGGIVIAEARTDDGHDLYVASVDHGVDDLTGDSAMAVFLRISSSGFPVDVVRRYPETDLVLLRIPKVSYAAYQEIGLQRVPLAMPPMPGDTLRTVTHPVLDNRQNYWMHDWEPTVDRVDTDGPATTYIVPRCTQDADGAESCNVKGRSGGAVFDRHGRLVGLVSRNRDDMALIGSIRPLLDELIAKNFTQPLVADIDVQFLLAAVQQRVAEVTQLCRHVDPTSFDQTLFSSLELVVRTGATPLIDALITCIRSQDHAIDFKKPLQDGSTLLIEAAYGGQFNLVEFLLTEEHVDPNQVSQTGSTALSATLGYAFGVPENRLKMAEFLLSHGAVPDHSHEEIIPAVLSATMANYMGSRQAELIELLVEYGADPLATYEMRYGDGEVRTLHPMIRLAEDSSSALGAWKLFIDTYEADLNVSDHDGLTPLMILARDDRAVLMGEFAEGDRGGCWSGPDHVSLKAMILLGSGRIDLQKADASGLTIHDHLHNRRIFSPGDERCKECLLNILETGAC